MSALILRHNWTRLPHQPVVSSELATELGVIGFFPGNGTLDLVGRRRITLAGNGKIGTLGQSRAIVGDTSAACGSFPLDLSALNTFSLSFYYLHPEVIGNDDLLFEHSNNTNTNPAAFFFNLKDSGNGGVCSLTMRGGAAVYNVKKFTPPSAGIHHVIVSFDGSTTYSTKTFSLYIDGNPVVLSATSSSVVYTGNFRNDTLFLMSRNNASLFAGSALSAFTIYNRLVRDDSEAARIAANPWAILTLAQRRLWVAGETSSTVDNLTATDLITGSPVLGTPALGQVHVLTASDLVAGAPLLGSPALAENLENVDILFAQNLVTGAPVLGSPALTQIHALIANDLTVGAPILGTPALSDGTVQPSKKRGGGAWIPTPQKQKAKPKKPQLIDAPTQSEDERIIDIGKAFDPKPPVKPTLEVFDTPDDPSAIVVSQPEQPAPTPLVISTPEDVFDDDARRIVAQIMSDVPGMVQEEAKRVAMMRMRDEDEVASLIMIFASV